MYHAKSFGMTLVLGVILAIACMQPMAAADELNIDVDVTATTDAVSTYIWSIDKWADRRTLTVNYGEEVPVNYCVTVDVCCADDEYLVSGDIYVTNEGPGSVDIYDVVVTISPDIPATADCGITFSYALDESETLTCSYSALLPDDSTRTVSVDVTVNGLSGYQGTADVNFTGVVPEELDECVEVTDDYEGYLGSACVWEAPKTFYYTRLIGGSEVCGCDEVVNHAYFTTNDTGLSACAIRTISVLTPCDGACTRGPGYWKTHSEYGPAPYDDTWAELPNGAATDFFLSGQSYYQVMWTPKRGNAYYILAFQWIAAHLNVQSGASVPNDVLDAWLEAQEFFETYTPEDIAALKSTGAAPLGPARLRSRTRTRSEGNDELRQQLIELAEILAMYNEGYVGPGHCWD
ncbi:MAG: hypothetical protein MUQ65_00160 [Armatimonadetes bacterium]|nr:hypothetical protein [Armatimonadota bacterium]